MKAKPFCVATPLQIYSCFTITLSAAASKAGRLTASSPFLQPFQIQSPALQQTTCFDLPSLPTPIPNGSHRFSPPYLTPQLTALSQPSIPVGISWELQPAKQAATCRSSPLPPPLGLSPSLTPSSVAHLLWSLFTLYPTPRGLSRS